MANAHETLFWRKDEMSTVRQGNHKLIHLDNFGDVVFETSNGMVNEEHDLLATGTSPLSDSL
ncbi:MAG: hypothetical protein AB8H12_24665 [Lewinella sp.]